MTSRPAQLNLTLWLCILICVLTTCNSAFAQTSISGRINNYTAITGFPGDCQNAITISSTAGFSAGTHVLIIQMQGATIDETNSASYGNLNAYNGAGLYEKAVILLVDGNEITLAADLVNTYEAGGKVQMVNIPQYTDVVVNGELTALPWNGTTGGVLAFEASGTVTLNASISVDGMGFRGGGITTNMQTLCGNFPNFPNSPGFYYPSDSWQSAFKGEGIAAITFGRELGKGPQANGGGGGNDHNAGGGGGSNYGVGGKGGNNNTPIFTCTGPNPGLGGKLIRSDSRAFLGGGGGGGHSNDNVGTPGGNGGGIIYMKASILIGNDRTISANGISATNGNGDGGGGGGAGGTILINLDPANPIINGLNIQIQGGDGATIGNLGQRRCLGPGGGGGGGLVASTIDLTDILSEVTDVALAGGNPGLTINSTDGCNNSTNGAASGGEGSVLSTFIMPMGTIITGELCNPVPTPVEFIRFTAQLNNVQVNLEWLTASETSNDYFVVERSDDNQLFTEITRAAGSGNSLAIKKYQAIDRNPMYGMAYYRIRQVDIDGKFTYSKVVTVDNNLERFTFTVFPNPAQVNVLYLKIYMPEAETIQIQLTDILGKIIFSSSKHLTKGRHILELNATAIHSGVYFIHVKTDTGYKTQKIKVAD